MRKGFTLVELSIVLIVIGILLGSALKSTELIKNSRAKKNIADIVKLVDAQHGFFEKTGRYAGDTGNDGLIDFTDLDENYGTLDDSAFSELENMGLLPQRTANQHAELTEGGPAYFAGILFDDDDGNSTPLNVLLARNVACLTAFQMEINLDKTRPDEASSASSGRVRAVLEGALPDSGAWTSSSICADDADRPTDLVYIFGGI